MSRWDATSDRQPGHHNSTRLQAVLVQSPLGSGLHRHSPVAIVQPGNGFGRRTCGEQFRSPSRLSVRAPRLDRSGRGVSGRVSSGSGVVFWKCRFAQHRRGESCRIANIIRGCPARIRLSYRIHILVGISRQRGRVPKGGDALLSTDRKQHNQRGYEQLGRLDWFRPEICTYSGRDVERRKRMQLTDGRSGSCIAHQVPD